MRWYYRFKTFIYYTFFNPRLIAPRSWYRRSDEFLKFQHILEAVNYVRVAELPAVFFEFGCHSGRTFSSAINSGRYLGNPIDAYAFDSFEGLPETTKRDDGYFEKGTFYTPLDEFKSVIRRQTGISLQPHQMIKGFYDQSLTSELKGRLPAKVGFVHIDVDLYSSTVTVLEFLKDLFADGAVVLFDDWYCFPPGKNMGEKRALTEFLARYPEFRFHEWKNYSTFGKSFFVERVKL